MTVNEFIRFFFMIMPKYINEFENVRLYRNALRGNSREYMYILKATHVFY